MAERGKILFQLDKISSYNEFVPKEVNNDEISVIESITESIVKINDRYPYIARRETPCIADNKELSLAQKASFERVRSTYYQVYKGLFSLVFDSLFIICDQDFSIRRSMMLKRLDVTLQSFLWGEKALGKEGEIVAAIQAQRRFLHAEPYSYQVGKTASHITADKSLNFIFL